MSGPVRISLSDERRRDLVEALVDFCAESFGEELSSYRAERILEFLLSRLGPAVYNQAIQDARGFIQEKLEDLEAEFYEPEPDERDGDQSRTRSPST